MRNLFAIVASLVMGAPVALLLVTATVHAADDLSSCHAIDDDAARLACYDAASGRVATRTPARSSAASSVAAASAPAATAQAPVTTEASFGLPPMRPEDELTYRLTAVVTQVTGVAQGGRWTITLDNGQIWEQREATPSYTWPRAGDHVTIRAAALGSYVMADPGRGSSRVRRVR